MPGQLVRVAVAGLCPSRLDLIHGGSRFSDAQMRALGKPSNVVHRGAGSPDPIDNWRDRTQEPRRKGGCVKVWRVACVPVFPFSPCFPTFFFDYFLARCFRLFDQANQHASDSFTGNCGQDRRMGPPRWKRLPVFRVVALYCMPVSNWLSRATSLRGVTVTPVRPT